MLCLFMAAVLMPDYQALIYWEKKETHLQRQHFPIDAIECCHSKCPRQQTSHVPTDFSGTFKSVIIHVEVRLQQLNGLFVDGVLGELLEAPQEPRGTHQLENTTTACRLWEASVLLPESARASKEVTADLL